MPGIKSITEKGGKTTNHKTNKTKRKERVENKRNQST